MTTLSSENQGENGFSPSKRADEMYQCHYCMASFTPTKRFVQKYCGESCRVLACRQRKTGINNIQDTKNDKKESFGGKAGNNKEQKDIKKEILEDILPELKAIISERDKVLEKKLRDLSNKINWAIGLSGLGAVTDETKHNLLNKTQNILHVLQNLSQVSNNSELGQKPKNALPPLGPLGKPNEQKAGKAKDSNDKKQH